MADQNNQKFEELIRSREPLAKNIEFIEHGYHNIVAVVDKKTVYRFPRDKKAEYWLIAEALILEKLNGKITNIPSCLKSSRDPVFSVQNFLPGEHLSEIQIAALPADKKQQIASELVGFMINYAKLISPEKLASIQKISGLSNSPLNEPWPIYLAKILGQAPLADNPQLEKLARDYYQRWLTVTANDKLPKTVLHDDLHVQNLLFNEGRISGILDFGDSSVGTATEEMRNFLPISEDFLQTAIDEYAKASSQKIDIKDVKIWAITTNLATLVRRQAANMTDSPGFIRARDDLRKWLPDFPL